MTFTEKGGAKKRGQANKPRSRGIPKRNMRMGLRGVDRKTVKFSKILDEKRSKKGGRKKRQ